MGTACCKYFFGNDHHENRKDYVEMKRGELMSFDDISYYLSMIMLIINPSSKPSLYGKTLVSVNNISDSQENWRFTLIIHKKLVDYIHNNNLSIEITFRHGYTTFESHLQYTQDIDNTDFTCYSFCHKCPTKNKDVMRLYIGLEKQECHLFNIAIFGNNIPKENNKLFNLKSYYEIFTYGLNKFNEEEFTKYWSMCINDYNNIPLVTHYYLSKNNVDEEHILKDPFFALFSISSDEDNEFWIEKLKLLNSDVDWRKLSDISRNFYKKYKYKSNHIAIGFTKIISTISYSVSLADHIDVNILGEICQKLYLERKASF